MIFTIDMHWIILFFLFVVGGTICYTIKKQDKEEEEASVGLEEIDGFLKRVREMVDPAIEELLSSGIREDFQEAMLYQVRAGGKRLRPALVFLGCKAAGGKEEDAIYPAAAIEILHNYSLIIDDIIDHSDTRRGKPTTCKKWGASVTECIGAHYITTAFQGALLSPFPELTANTLVKTMKVLLEGEIIDILQEEGGREEESFIKEKRYKNVVREDALEMMSKKTAKLFEASCFLGGKCANASQGVLESLKKYGFSLGMAFQIRDDILDVFGEEKDFGKKIGKDIEERKRGNIVVLFAREELLKGELEEVLCKKSIEGEDLQRAVEIIKKTGACKKALALSEEYIKTAKEALRGLPAGKEKDMMGNILEYLAQRSK